MAVFVLGSDNRPIMPCSEKRARLLLDRGRAYVVRIVPFVIRLKDRSQDDCELQDLEVKIDPGSKTTGLCLSRTVGTVVNILNLFELQHRGMRIKLALLARRAMRRARRNRNTRYRQARFLNRNKPKGWLPPSLRHRIDTTMSWVQRFQRWCPMTMLAVERVKFDMQKLRDPEVTGIEYQQGALFQYEVTEYLLEKWGRQCTYCQAEGVPLEKEHITPKARGGTNAFSNLALACRRCNLKKGSLPIEVFLANQSELLKKIKAQAKRPLHDAAAVNATRNALFTALIKTGLPVTTGTGAQTKYNRMRCGVPKTHAHDAACVGDVTQVNSWGMFHQAIKCMGRGRYQRTLLNKYGFPRLYLSPLKKAFGFQTGDSVKVLKTVKGICGSVIGKISIRQSGLFALTVGKTINNVSWRLCKLLQRADGYAYARRPYEFIRLPDRQLLTLGVL